MSANDKNNTAISVENVSKDFLLPHHNQPGSIKSIFTSPQSIFTGKNDEKERQHALRDISFSVKEGEFFGIVGRNGSGKSTLLKILAQIYTPTKGKVTIQGKLIPFIELGVGFNYELTGKENVYLSAALLGFSRSQTDAMYDDIVEFAELGRFMDQKLKNYSSGMQVRLAFSIATRTEGDILLIDEVLAVGDADFQRKCFDYFKELKRSKKTVVFVSHDMAAIKEYCDRAVLIDKNKIVSQSEAEDIAKLYTQLFNTNNSNENELRSDRWGDQEVIIEKPFIGIKKNKISVSLNVLAEKDLSDVTVGIILKDSQGISVVATNTKLLNKKIDLKRGVAKNVAFEFENVLNVGSYYLDVATTMDGGITVKDWWEACMKLEISKEYKTPSIINPEIRINIK